MEKNPDIALVPLARDLDVTSTASVRDTIEELISAGYRRIVVNMAGVSYVDSAGVALLFSEVRHMRELGGRISLINVGERVMRILRIVRLVDFVPASAAGLRPKVPEPDPKTLPTWRRALTVNPENLADTRGRLGNLLARLPLSADQRFDVMLAVGEAMGNAVDHAGGQDVLVTVSSYPDRVVVDVTDYGAGMELAADEAAPASPACAERGRGIRLMRLLVDSVSISRRDGGRGTRVRLVELF